MKQSHPTNQSVPVFTLKMRKVTIGLYIVAAFLYWISLYLYVPTLPTYVQTKTDSLVLVGTVLSMYGLWQAIVRLPLGIAVDWIGRRKPFIIAGLVLAGLGAWLMGAANDFSGLLVGRSVTGLAAAAWVPLLVAFSSLYPSDEAVRATAILVFANSTGRILAASSTGMLNTWSGYALPFFMAAGAAGLGILFVLPAREEPRSRRQPSLKGITHIIIRQDVLTPSLLAAISQYANWTTTFGFTPILAKQLGATDVTQSMLVTMHLVMVIIGNLCATVLIRQVGERRLVFFSFWMIAIGVGLTAVATSLTTLFVVQLFIGLSQGITIPVLMGLSIRYVDDSERNTAMGLHQSVYAIGMFGGPWLSGILGQVMGLRWMLFVTALNTLVLGLFGISKLEKRTLKLSANL
jgi:MFS family permease